MPANSAEQTAQVFVHSARPARGARLSRAGQGMSAGFQPGGGGVQAAQAARRDRPRDPGASPGRILAVAQLKNPDVEKTETGEKISQCAGGRSATANSAPVTSRTAW